MFLATLFVAACSRAFPGPPAPIVDVPLVDANSPSPVFEATVGGKTRRFMLDTAASTGMLSSRLIRDLALSPRGSGLGGDSSSHAGQTLSVYDFGGLRLGKATFDHIAVVGGPGGQDMGPLASVDGILSLDSFGGRVVTIDFLHRRLRIGGPRMDANILPHSVKFRSDHGCPILTAQVGNLRFEVRLDTGSEMGLLLPSSYEKSVHLVSKPQLAGSFRTMFHTFTIDQAEISDELSLGGLRLKLDQVSFSAAFPIANLGSRAMRGLTVAISPGEQRVAIM